MYYPSDSPSSCVSWTYPATTLFGKLARLGELLEHLALSRILHHHKHSRRVMEPTIQTYDIWMSQIELGL